MKKYHRVLTIAGSDSGGGAGIQADIKTISACGCYATSAITAITIQNTVGVQSVVGLPSETISGQIKAVLSDIGTDSVKIGMLHSSEIIKSISDSLSMFDIKEIVLDPVMVSTSGHKLIEDDAINSMKSFLIPKARVITPNIPEAEILSETKITKQAELPNIAKLLSDKFNVSVLLKAGHLTEDTLTDIFYNRESGKYLQLEGKRNYTQNTHGTGCTLSSAIAAMLAKGLDLDNAIIEAKKYLAGAIIAGSDYEIGHGHGPVCHFYNLWK